MDWKGLKTLVTGGASFIGSHLAEALLERGASVRVVDDLSSGKLENVAPLIDERRIDFVRGDLRDFTVALKATEGMDVVFHLAANHGGRGYLDRHQAACATNFVLDGTVFAACRQTRVGKVVFASSGCVYPNHLQGDPSRTLLLDEDLVRPPYDADNVYGWAKLMGELTLKAYFQEQGLKSASCRYFTVYGERGVENHALIAMIARAFVKKDPFDVWGTGEQIRNWTYVGDIVRGTILAAERIDDGTAVNLGTTERIRVIDAVEEILRITGHKAELRLQPHMPTGPLNRVADNRLAKKLLGWEPQCSFRDGVRRTIEWYFASKRVDDVKRVLDQKLLVR